MDYSKVYYQIIEQAKISYKEEYSENHHIVPKCLGGTNDKENLVRLSYREHFICHWLLIKIYPDNHKLKAAFAKMLESTKQKKRIISSRYFDIVKRNLKDIQYEWLQDSWKTPWNKGKKGLQTAWNKGLTIAHSEESNLKRSKTVKLQYENGSRVAYLSKEGTEPWNKGKQGLQVAWNKGKPAEKSPCLHCGMFVSATNMKRWHGDKCKSLGV